MSVYPETLFQKRFTFTYLPISNPLSHDVLRSIQGRSTLLYMSCEIILYIIAGIAIVALIVSYIKWRSAISRFLFAILLLLGGSSLFYLVFVLLTCSAVFATFKICGNDLMLHYFLCASFVPFPVVLCLLWRYVKENEIQQTPLISQYALFLSWFSMLRCLIFWMNNPLARIIYDKRTETAGWEIIKLGTKHKSIGLLFILTTLAMVNFLYKEFWYKARLRSSVIISHYIRLAGFTMTFVGIWSAANVYLYGHTIIDAAPLWIKYVIVLLPYIFYAIFSVWFMHVRYQTTQRAGQ